MEILDIISTKRYGHELSSEQIDFFINGVTKGIFPDYQISSLLMAIVLNGMTDEETYHLTMAMANSGEINDLSDIKGVIVDKHSTGGVGDKITPLIMALSRTFGIKTCKLSGRGLGFTGGTIDKFESIQKFNVNIDSKNFTKLINNAGMVISSQTKKLAPADKVLYALRDVTGTVDSIPLIASSIMSKKIAGGAKILVLDVTCGSGAFMKSLDEARELARLMVEIGKKAGIKTSAIITNMDQPLGNTCGNALEMKEVYRTLGGMGCPDVVEVACTIAAKMVTLAGLNDGLEGDDLLMECYKRLTNGDALAEYLMLLDSQGADISNGIVKYVEDSFEEIRICSPETGFISSIKTDQIGNASCLLGAGRLRKEDIIDYGAGLYFYKKVGDKVKKGDVICSLNRGVNAYIDDARLFDVASMVQSAYSFSEEEPAKMKAILDIIE